MSYGRHGTLPGASDGHCGGTVKLKSVRIQNYRSITNSGVVPIDPDVTCLVGKNESGKTAFLRALHLLRPLNPIKGKTQFDAVIDFPAKDYGRYKSGRGDSQPKVVHATFELQDNEVAAIEAELGKGAVTSRELPISRGYDSGTTFSTSLDESVVVRHLTAEIELVDTQQKQVADINTIAKLYEFLADVVEPHSSVTALHQRIKGWREQRLPLHVIDEYLTHWIPRFFYFDEYSTMPGRIAVDVLKSKIDRGQELTEGEKAFQAFLSLGGADLAAVQAGSRTEAMIRELENAGIAITAEAMQFWTQNDGLRVKIRESQADPDDEDANLRTGQILNLRIENTNQYGVTSPFDERSRGFVWFFSFLAYFSGIEQDHEDGEIILLLDEPGLSLHGSAQADFLRFINERLAIRHQVIYTTHSPFLVEPDRFDRVRTVEDAGDAGTQVSADIFRSQPGTSLPILTKMGVDLFQTLMVGPNTLLLEGGSDFLYLQVLSQELVRRSKAGLDERWVLVPVTGIGKFEPFFRLYQANEINVAVLMDASTTEQKLVDALKAADKGKHVVTVGDILGTADADIEDLLGEEFYLRLVEATYGLATLDPTTFTSQHPRVVKRLEQHFQEQAINGGKFSHYKPASHLRENKELLKKLKAKDVANIEKMVEKLNGLIRA